MKPILFDICCKAGGCSKGYHLAGFRVIGMDIEAQPRYPFEFIRGDIEEGFPIQQLAALGVGLHEIVVFHASPPCQSGSQMFCPTKPEKRRDHKNLIPLVRELFQSTGQPYVIENVKGMRCHLINPLCLDGSMFGLPIYRDRYFEINPSIWFAPAASCKNFTPVPINSSSKKGNTYATVGVMAEAMRIDWMTKAELREAIPPAYTEWIGKQLIGVLA